MTSLIGKEYCCARQRIAPEESNVSLLCCHPDRCAMASGGGHCPTDYCESSRRGGLRTAARLRCARTAPATEPRRQCRTEKATAHCQPRRDPSSDAALERLAGHAASSVFARRTA